MSSKTGNGNIFATGLFASNPDRHDKASLLSRQFRNAFFLSALLLLVLPAWVSGASGKDPWIFSAGYTYYSGFENIRSTYKKNAVASGARHDIVQWAFGFTFQVHQRISETLRIGASIGPLMTLLKDANHIQAPASVSAITTLFPNAVHSPFIRAGVSYHIAKGDYLRHSRPGLLGGLGITFFAQKPLHLTIEVAYDGAYVTIERPTKSTPRKIRAGALMLSVSAVF